MMFEFYRTPRDATPAQLKAAEWLGMLVGTEQEARARAAELLDADDAAVHVFRRGRRPALIATITHKEAP